MARGRIVDAVSEGRVLVSDGAWGTLLQARGLPPGQCPELWCIERPDDVQAIAAGYVAAGADMVKTNSFGGSRLKLSHYGLDARVEEINAAASALSRRAAGEDRWVIASLGPTGRMLAAGDITERELYGAFFLQAHALAEGGADALLIETMSATDEAAEAVHAARDAFDGEVICTFTFEKIASGEYRTMMGVSPEDAVNAALESGADVIGANCGNGMERMIDIVSLMRRAVPGVPILVHANAGLPQVVNGEAVFPEAPEAMASWVPRLIEAGAGIIGGCCGTTPAHIAAIRAAVDAR